MPCNKLAVRSGTIPTGLSEMMQTEAGRDVLITMIFRSFNANGVLAGNLVPAAPGMWRSMYGEWTRTGTVQRPTIGPGPHEYMDFVSDGACVRILADGTVELRDGWNQSRRPDSKRSESTINHLLRSSTGWMVALNFASTVTAVAGDMNMAYAIGGNDEVTSVTVNAGGVPVIFAITMTGQVTTYIDQQAGVDFSSAQRLINMLSALVPQVEWSGEVEQHIHTDVQEQERLHVH